MKKVIALLSLCFVVVLVSFTSINNKKLIVIDVGHGGHDHGATFEDLKEKEIVAQIANKIYEYNDPSTVEIVLLRDADEFVSLQDRITKINELNPDLVLSLHVNQSKNKEAKGLEAFISEKNPQYQLSEAYAQKILTHQNPIKLEQRGIKKANFLLLRESKAAAITLELGFISNESDKDYLTSDKGQDEIAQSILKSLQ